MMISTTSSLDVEEVEIDPELITWAVKYHIKDLLNKYLIVAGYTTLPSISTLTERYMIYLRVIVIHKLIACLHQYQLLDPVTLQDCHMLLSNSVLL